MIRHLTTPNGGRDVSWAFGRARRLDYAGQEEIEAEHARLSQEEFEAESEDGEGFED
jgi:hypothetical protein